MLLLVTTKLNDDELAHAAEDLGGYIKVVVDVERRILTAGGKKHSDGEAPLLQNGGRQEHLWGGGLDLKTGAVDFDSMINIRPRQDNPSREVLNAEIRRTMEIIIRDLLR
ncbi:MAG: DUF5674 family protein [bacterium]|nr:DUF5674 family protein [bacterium]